jgi:inorganic pyrophosphatase
MLINVFVQNEAGSRRKNYHDEKTLEFKCMKPVSRPYPYPYGFIVGTTASDGCNLDCYVITEMPLKTGQTVECEPIGLMEQIEDGVEDHNVLARLAGESAGITAENQATLIDFVENVFSHIEGKQVRAGHFLPATGAEAYIRGHLDSALGE